MVTRRASAAVLAVLALSACGSPEGNAGSAAPPTCLSTAVPAEVASGAVDQRRLADGGVLLSSNGDYAAGTTEQLLNGYPVIAVVTATTRSEPVALQGGGDFPARSSEVVLARPPAQAGQTFQVVRPVTLEVTRLLRGALAQTCLDLAVPGGSAGAFAQHEPTFPARIAVGEPMLALFSDSDLAETPPALGMLVPPRADGTYVLPFGDRRPFDVTRWSVPPYSSPTPVPGGIRPDPS